jgi:hypothetical protein
MSDIDGVNFAGVKALELRTTQLSAQLEAARSEIAARDARIDELEARLARIEARLPAP